MRYVGDIRLLFTLLCKLLYYTVIHQWKKPIFLHLCPLSVEEKSLLYEKKLAIYEEIIKKCEASKERLITHSSSFLT